MNAAVMTDTAEYVIRASERYWRGGAKVGSQGFCYGLAELEVAQKALVLRTADCQQYSFKPEQILGFETCECASHAPFPASAIRILHRVAGYPKEIVFLFFCHEAEPFLGKLKTLVFGWEYC